MATSAISSGKDKRKTKYFYFCQEIVRTGKLMLLLLLLILVSTKLCKLSNLPEKDPLSIIFKYVWFKN